MKIFMIAPTIYQLRYPYIQYGGIEPIMGNLAVELEEQGHEVIVAAPKGSNLRKIKIIETVDANINYNYNSERESCEIAMKYYFEHCKDFLIHDHTHQKYIYLHKAKYPELKVCSTLHNQVNFSNPPPNVRKMNLICISNNHAAETSGILGIHVKMVYNGINVDAYNYNENKQDYFLFLSRIARQKGAHEAIQACKEAGVKLFVAGEDVFVQDPRYVFDVMSSCDGKNIKYLGNITEEKKKELLSGAKALILPLTWPEPFGIIALEALASGTPVITTPRGAMPEIIQHRKSGFFTQNIGEIKSAIKIIDDIKPIDCFDRAKEFSTNIMAEKYLELYEKILKGDEW